MSDQLPIPTQRYPFIELPPPPSEPYNVIEGRIQFALRFFEDNNIVKPNLSEAARKCGVPYGRLRARYLGRPPRTGRPGSTKLNVAQEAAVCDFLDRLEYIGTNARMRMLRRCANQILAANHPDTDTSRPLRVSTPWPKRFLARHQEYYVKKQHSLDKNRKDAQDKQVIRDFFYMFDEIFRFRQVRRYNIWNYNETGARIGVGKKQQVITRSRNAVLDTGSTTNRTHATNEECINAAGDAIPPMVILPGYNHQEKWYANTNLEWGTLIGVSETGYANDQLSLEWAMHFVKISARFMQDPNEWRILLLDGYGSHLTKQFTKYLEDHKVVAICLPPHSTHFLQPLDVGVFQPFKHWHKEAVDDATRMGCPDFDKVEYLAALRTIRAKTFKPQTIKSIPDWQQVRQYTKDYSSKNSDSVNGGDQWQKITMADVTRLYRHSFEKDNINDIDDQAAETEDWIQAQLGPIPNPNGEIPDPLFEFDPVGKAVFGDAPDSSNTDEVIDMSPRPRPTPEARSATELPTKIPTTPRGVKRLNSAVYDDAIERGYSPSFVRKLEMSTAAGEALANVSQQLTEELCQTQAATAVRKQRQAGSKRALQGGGVLYSDHGREMVENHMDEEVEKSRRPHEQARLQQERLAAAPMEANLKQREGIEKAELHAQEEMEGVQKEWEKVQLAVMKKQEKELHEARMKEFKRDIQILKSIEGAERKRLKLAAEAAKKVEEKEAPKGARKKGTESEGTECEGTESEGKSAQRESSKGKGN